MKKLLTGIASLVIGLNSFGANVATNLVTTAVGGNAFVLLTNRASVYQVTLTASYPTLVRLFDQNTLTAPYYGTNWVNSAYVGVNSYATNYVTSFIGQNGYTNWYTNAGVFTYTNAVAANTNAMNPAASFVVGAGIYAVYNTDALFAKGLVAHASTNVSIVITYRP